MNLPTEGLLDPDWMSGLPARLERLGATPDRFAFEIVESAIADHGAARKHLEDLRRAGYSILLDDVGTGESSLLRLAELPVSGIKIDQAFARPLQRDMTHLDLMFSMIRLAEQRGIECVVEGVETEGIVDSMASIADPLMQGYAIARPMPAHQLPDFLARGARHLPQNFPCTLQDWYARHVARLLAVRTAFCSIPDLLDIATLRDDERCPLHAPIAQLGGDEKIVRAHLDWHERYAHYADMVRQGAGSHALWVEMEAQKLRLHMLVQKKLGLDGHNGTP